MNINHRFLGELVAVSFYTFKVFYIYEYVETTDGP